MFASAWRDRARQSARGVDRRHGGWPLPVPGISTPDPPLALPRSDRAGILRLDPCRRRPGSHDSPRGRRRDLPLSPPGGIRRAGSVIVNIPEFRLRAFDVDDPEPRLSMRVVVGSAVRRTKTPVVHGHMRWVVFRPYWESRRASPARRYSRARPANHRGRDPRAVPSQHELRPGPRNALGLVKFVFPNSFDVYLHDTQSLGGGSGDGPCLRALPDRRSRGRSDLLLRRHLRIRHAAGLRARETLRWMDGGRSCADTWHGG